MRVRGRADDNQGGIVKQLRQLHVSVLDTHLLGHGAPDIATGFRGENRFFELKDPNKPPSQRQLTYEEQLWHQTWNGQIDTVTSLEEILEVLGILKVQR